MHASHKETHREQCHLRKGLGMENWFPKESVRSTLSLNDLTLNLDLVSEKLYQGWRDETRVLGKFSCLVSPGFTKMALHVDNFLKLTYLGNILKDLIATISVTHSPLHLLLLWSPSHAVLEIFCNLAYLVYFLPLCKHPFSLVASVSTIICFNL